MSNDMNYDSMGFSSLPQQKLPKSQKDKEWGKSCINYYSNYRYTNGTTIRTDRFRKLVNYDLYNGKVSYNDVEAICNPLGIQNNSWSTRFQHYDIISECLRFLISEEAKRPDNHIVISEAPEDLNRKTEALHKKMVGILEQDLMGHIDPSTIDPNNPPPKPEQLLKSEKYNPSDEIESKATKMLKVLKKRLNTHLQFREGWKDALISGEEIYWVGILNGSPIMRRVNPVNMTIILDDDHTFVDDAIAVVEERMLTISSILDEYGDELTKADLEKVEQYTRGTFGSFNTAGGFEPHFTIKDGHSVFDGVTPTNAYNGNNSNNYSIRVSRVEWISLKKIGTLTYTDETGTEVVEDIDEDFKLSLFRQQYSDTKVEWFWINEAWEGVKIGIDIYVGIQAKPNQRRRMDNPYHCQLGYTGFIYEATNSQSVSLLDRLKPYQYLYDIISYRLELAFAKDKGKIMLMDVAQLPESQGIDIDRWIHYMNEMGISFVNSFEEGKKGAATGQLAKFNQFQAIDLSLAQSIQQYINMLDYIKQQVYFVSGVTPQRLGAINTNELVGNVEKAVSQSSIVTEYLFEAHQEVKRRAYTAIIEVAKIAYKDGLTTQYVLDDMGIEMLHLDEFEFENSEFSVFVSYANRDNQFKSDLKNLMNIALQRDKVTLSTIADTLINDSPRDIIHVLKRADEEAAQAAEAAQNKEMSIEQQKIDSAEKIHQEQMADKQADRDLKQYVSDTTNETKIQVAELATYNKVGPLDEDNNGIPDPLEIGKLALEERKLASQTYAEQLKLHHDHSNKKKELGLKEKELKSKEGIENKKLQAVKVQNANQIELANKKHKADKEIMDKKMEIEKMKAKAAIIKSRQKPKK